MQRWSRYLGVVGLCALLCAPLDGRAQKQREPEWDIRPGNLSVFDYGSRSGAQVMLDFSASESGEFLFFFGALGGSSLPGTHTIDASSVIGAKRSYKTSPEPYGLWHAWTGEVCIETERVSGNRARVTVYLYARFVPDLIYRKFKHLDATPPREYVRQFDEVLEFVVTPQCFVADSSGTPVDEFSSFSELPQVCADALFGKKHECP